MIYQSLDLEYIVMIQLQAAFTLNIALRVKPLCIGVWNREDGLRGRIVIADYSSIATLGTMPSQGFSATGCRPARAIAIELQAAATAGEDAEMAAEIADELEMRGKAAVVQHAPGVAADRKDAAGFNGMVFIPREHPFVVWYAAAPDAGSRSIEARRPGIRHTAPGHCAKSTARDGRRRHRRSRTRRQALINDEPGNTASLSCDRLTTQFDTTTSKLESSRFSTSRRSM